MMAAAARKERASDGASDGASDAASIYGVAGFSTPSPVLRETRRDTANL